MLLQQCLELETKLLKKKDFVENEVFDKLVKSYSILEKHCISLALSTQLNQEIFQKENSGVNQNALTFNQLFEINELKAQSQEKDIVIRKLKEKIKSLSRKDTVENVKNNIDELETINIELEHSVAKLLSENENLRKEREHLKLIYKDQFKCSTSRKGFCYYSIENELRKLNVKSVIDTTVSKPSVVTIAPEVHKLNIEPISPRLKNNMDAYEDYLKKTIENTDTLRGLVKYARNQNPSEPLLDYACRSKPSGNRKNNRISQFASSNKTNKVKDHSKSVNSRKNKKKRVDKTKCTADVMQSVLNANSVSKPISNALVKHSVVQIVLWYLDSGCSKHMTGNRSQLINFVSTFLGTVRFGNDRIAKIMGYGDYQIGNVTISQVYYVEGLGHNLFSVGQFCDSDLEVAFCKHTCFISNLEGVDLLKGSRGSNLYTLSLENLMLSSPMCLLSKASKTKSWLWHRRLSHLNFDYINSLAKQGLVRGIPKLKYQKDHLFSACTLSKIKKHSHKPKAEDSIQEKLYLLHMDLCGPMRIQSINGRKYILVIVDDYSQFTWVKFLHSMDEILAFNGVVERQNRTLVEASLTMLIFSKAPLFLWAEVVATACSIQNQSLIRKRHNKMPYELLHERKPDLSYIHVFSALCYPTNDGEDIGKLRPKADIGIFVGYALMKKAFRIYNKWTRLIIETIHFDFDEFTAMAFEQFSSGPGLNF
ncbi:retrovirus-related pol polyprotein from transposon TNT 1-94 [Tanacetum coccineum]